MIFVEDMKNLKMYRRPLYLPFISSDKKKGSAIYLLTPNYESSKNLMLNPLLTNQSRFASYYIEKDLTYFISSKVMKQADNMVESYVSRYNEIDLYHSLCEMSSSERKRLPDKAFGLPEKRKYPLTDKEHVLLAIKFFNYVEKEDEIKLAKSIIKAIPKFFDNGELPNVGDRNRFKKYYNPDSVNESVEFLKEAHVASTEELLHVAEIISNMIKDDSGICTKFLKPVELEDGIVSVGTVENNSIDELCAILNTKMKYSIMSDYFVFYKAASENISYLCIALDQGASKIDINNLSSKFEKDIASSILATNESNNDVPVDSKWVQDIHPLNTPDTAIESVSAIVRNVENKWLLLDHNKCNAYTLPGGKIDEGEDTRSAIVRELREELGIVPTDMAFYCTTVFLCEYPNGSGNWLYFKDHCFKIKSYSGVIQNLEPKKHKEIIFAHPDRITVVGANPSRYPYNISKILGAVLSRHNTNIAETEEKFGSVSIYPDDIVCTGSLDDLKVIKHVANPTTYKSILDVLELNDIISRNDIPIVEFRAQFHNSVYAGTDKTEHRARIVIDIDKREDSESIINTALFLFIIGILHSKYPVSKNTKIPQMIAGYYTHLDDYHRDLVEKIVDNDGIKALVSLCSVGDVTSLIKMASKYGYRFTREDIIVESESFSAEQIAHKIKYQSTKLKRKNGTIRNKTKNLIDHIKDDIEEKTKAELPNVGSSSSSTPSSDNTEEDIETVSTESLLNNLTEASVKFGDCVTLFEDVKYDPKLRQILYKHRLVNRKEVLVLFDRVKNDCSFIKYTYPDIDRYQKRNLFVDLYYYNSTFFEHNDWSLRRGYELYFDFLDRLINDTRITKAGYTTQTVFVPITDWSKNSVKVWNFREDINPISIIYDGMVNNPDKIKKLFGKKDVVFFGNDIYFKMNFSQMETVDMKKESVRFRSFVTKIQNGEDIPVEEFDGSQNIETPKVIRTKMIDKIEKAKGVDLTAAVNNAEKKKKDDITIVKPTNKSNKVETKKPPKEKEKTPVPTEEDELPISKLSRNLDNDFDTKAEEDIEYLARAIVDVSDNSDNIEDALDNLDYDEIARKTIMDLDNDDKVNISNARADRMLQLDRELLDKEFKGKSVRDILEDSEKKEKESLPVSSLKIASPNECWQNMQYMNFGKTYDVDADIIEAFHHFANVSRPLSVRDIKVSDNSTSEDRVELYEVSLEDYRGTRYTVKLDIPVAKNKRYLLRGNERNIQTQFCNMPIIKTDLDTCQVVSNYNKIIVYRFNASSGRSLPQVSKFMKAANKYNGRKIKFTYGDNTKVCAKYHLPIDYIDLSSVFTKIETDEFIVYFDQDEIRKVHEIDEKKGIPWMYSKVDKRVYYLDQYSGNTFIEALIYLSFGSVVNKDNVLVYKDFLELYESTKPVARGMYSMASIMDSKIPLIVVCAYSEGLTSVLKKARIRYHFSDKRSIDNSGYYDHIIFKDGYLNYEVTYYSSLLLNGLKDCSTELYSFTEVDDRNMYLDFLDNFGGRIKADGLDNAYDCTIDPITKKVLEFYHLPTDYIKVLLHVNNLLADNKFIRHTDTSSRRIRREELIAAYTYKALSIAYRTYANELKHGGSRQGFALKQSAVIDMFLLDPTSSDSSVINLLNDVETTNAITTKGLSGMNSDRAYSLDKRTYDESMLNVLGMSTGFSANVGITRQATLNMNVDTERGYVKSIKGNTSKMNSANTLTATEAVIPFASTHDDPIRTAMSFVQTSKHSVRTVDSDPLLVTNGGDEAIAYISSDKFAHKAKKEGVIKEVTEEYMIVEYKDGDKEYIDLRETIEKNSDGGFYVPLKLDIAEKFKQGSKVKPGDIIAYDRLSLSNSVGESDNLAYNVGKLAKVAIINTDEGYEDSGIITERMSHMLATKLIEKMDVVLDKNTNIFNVIPLNSKVEEGDTLLLWQTPYEDEDVSALLKAMADDKEAVSELGRHRVKSELTGTIVGIKVYRTVDTEELSDSLKKLVSEYEAPITELKKKLEEEKIDFATLPPNYPLAPVGKLKNATGGVLIEFYVEYLDTVAVGDKIVYNAANKAVIKNIIPQDSSPYTDFRPNEPIDAFVSLTSIAKRGVNSIPVYGAIQKLMVELDRKCKDIAGIKYDDSTI